MAPHRNANLILIFKKPGMYRPKEPQLRSSVIDASKTEIHTGTGGTKELTLDAMSEIEEKCLSAGWRGKSYVGKSWHSILPSSDWDT